MIRVPRRLWGRVRHVGANDTHVNELFYGWLYPEAGGWLVRCCPREGHVVFLWLYPPRGVAWNVACTIVDKAREIAREGGTFAVPEGWDHRFSQHLRVVRAL